MANDSSWDQEDSWWRQNFNSRPYAAGQQYDDFRPAYRYGYESGRHHMGRSWNDVESDLRTGWNKYEHRPEGSESTWDRVKDAVQDAWHKVTGQSDVDTHKMSESNTSSTSRRL
jgi:hypothetical protein